MKTFWKIVFGSMVGCILSLFVIGILSIGAISSIGSQTVESVPESAVLKIDFSKPIKERGGSQGSINLSDIAGSIDENLSLIDVIRAIDYAATDPQINFIYINTDKFSGDITLAEEIRDALVRFRNTGKAIVAYGSTYSTTQYYIASVADKIIINSEGESQIYGVFGGMIFIKDLIEKLGVEVQLIRHGKFKSAGEMFTNNTASENNLLQNQVCIDDTWQTICDEVSMFRDCTSEDFNRWVDNLSFRNAKSMVERKICDEAMFKSEVEDYLCSLANVEKFSDVKFITLDKYVKARIINDIKIKDKIAIIYANGEIKNSGNPQESVIGDHLAEQISKARRDSSIKAVVFRINSPGGSVQASEIIRQEIIKLQEVKPVIASYGSTAASGGYWISAGANKIFTNKTTTTGSIGVFSMVPNISKALKDKLGVNVVIVKSTKHADIISPFSKLNEAEIKFIQDGIEDVYTKFTNIVADGRNMSVESVDNIGQGRIWSGRSALNIGLADEEGGLYDAIGYASALVNLDKYQLVEYPKTLDPISLLMEKFNGESEKSISVKLYDNEFIDYTKRTLESIKEPVTLARLPYIIVEQ